MAKENASVRRFQRVMAVLPKRVAARAQEVLDRQAQDLAAEIRAAAPARSGALRASIKVEPGRKPLTVAIRAGGARTKKGSDTFTGAFRDAFSKGSRGKAMGVRGLYDYARAIEFGAVGRPAKPFFFSTWRKSKARRRRELAEACAKALAEEFGNG